MSPRDKEQDFWIEVRRGILTLTSAVDDQSPYPRDFWLEIKRGLLKISRAVEYRYGLPIHSGATLGVPIQAPEPPATPLARYSPEGRIE
jgi:hypothetical protein